MAGSGGTTYLEVYSPFMERVGRLRALFFDAVPEVRAAEEALSRSHESAGKLR